MDAELTPRTSTELFGHAAAEEVLMRDLAAGKLAHGWLISGPNGVGKATLAYRFARTLLSCHPERSRGILPQERSFESLAFPQDDNVFHRIAAGSHADLLVVEPKFDTKKDEYAREISVEQARAIGQFLSLTPGESQWRVVIVDAIDALNANAANAILKILEEPPKQAVLLLVSHNPARLLPTIRSRCRALRLAPLKNDDFYAAMRHIAPEIGLAECDMLAQLSNHSPGVVLKLHGQGAIDLYGQLLDLMSPLPQLNTLSIHGFAERIGGAQAHANWQLFTRLMLCLLERVAAYAAGAGGDSLSDEEAQAWQTLAALHPAHVWAEKWQHCADQFALAEARHLDYKQIVIAFFHSLAATEAFQIGSFAA